MERNICCIFKLAPHYRAPIYKLMDLELHCDFYFGNQVKPPIKLMNYNDLKGFKKILKNISLVGNFYWQKNALSLAFKPYNQYIITGELYCLSTWIILIITKLFGRKTYLWTHGWYGDESFVKIIIKKFYFSLCYKVLLYGDYARHLMMKEGFKPDKLIPIYNSLDYDKQCKIRAKLNLTNIYKDHFCNNFPVLLFIGRIQKVKKLNMLIEALKTLRYEGFNCNLIIIGKENRDDNGIHNLIYKYKLEKKVWFYGTCYDEEILGELIFNAELCVSPGNVGLTAMHSLVYGTPLITHNNFVHQMPEFEAIKEGVTGSYFVEDSVEDLCVKIIPWITLTSEKREFIRKKCAEIIHEKYNPHKQLETLKKNMVLHTKTS